MLPVRLSFAVLALAPVAARPAPPAMEELEVVAVAPIGSGAPAGHVPARVQAVSAEDLERAQALDLTDYMNRALGGVTLNAAQNNPLQPDLQFRGFTASPLLGLPQGLAVYQDGVRVNEPFGDAVNWDLIPQSAIAGVELIAGANPVFGLNTLGGALALTTKDGFSFQGHRLRASGGSFSRVVASAESGGNDGRLGYYVNVHHFDEEGWRDFSPSDALNLFGAVSWRAQGSSLDLSVAHADTELRGNGPVPAQLLARDRKAVFTHPDITENDHTLLTLDGSHWMGDVLEIAGNAYWRRLDTDSFNGDGSPFGECDIGPDELLVEEFEEDDLPDTDGDGEPGPCAFASLAAADAAGIEPVLDDTGSTVDGGLDAVNNRSRREQTAYGATLQATWHGRLAGRGNTLVAGIAWSQGLTDFDARVELAALTATRGTTGTGRFVPAEATRVATRTRSYGVYVHDTLELTPSLALVAAARFNSTRVVVRDRSGINPELTGDHDFDRINPMAGITWDATDALTFYASYGESTRAPTPVELACASPQAPCNLPNAFLADPPLDQVVARSVQGGVRGWWGEAVRWSVDLFTTTNSDDIVFQTTGGVQSNQGFFANVGDTRRRGVELALEGEHGRLGWSLDYSFVEATFEDAFTVLSPNHPLAGPGGAMRVEAGDRIPGIPEHTVKAAVDWTLRPGARVGAELVANSDQVLRGDEANLLDTVDGYALVNLRASWDVTRQLQVFARVDNLFDTDYETFGLLGDPGEVLGPAFTDPRFLGPGAPRAGWVGVRLSL